MPGGIANVTRGEGVRRGVGYAVGYKNIGYSEGFDDYSTARVRLSLVHDEPLRVVHDKPYPYDVKLRVPSVEKAKAVLGFEATTTLDEALDEIVPWVQKQVRKEKYESMDYRSR